MIYAFTGNTGNITIGPNGIPTAQNAGTLTKYRLLNGVSPLNPVIAIFNATTNDVNVPGWDVHTGGDVTFQGNANCHNLNVGDVKTLSL